MGPIRYSEKESWDALANHLTFVARVYNWKQQVGYQRKGKLAHTKF